MEAIQRAANLPLPKPKKGDYYNAEGMLVCGKCHRRRTYHVKAMGIDKVVRCMCACEMEGVERAGTDRTARILRTFPDSRFASMTFAKDDSQESEASKSCRNYAETFGEYDGVGIILAGPQGTGKTYLASAIVNELMDKTVCRFMTMDSARNLARSAYEGYSLLQSEIRKCGLVVYDDIGAERNTPEMSEIKRVMISTAYDAMVPMVITTNLKLSECGLEPTMVDRIVERCVPITLDGESRRAAIAEKNPKF